MEEINNFYDLLWQVWQKEKQSNELQLIPTDFYINIIENFKNVKNNDITSITTKENTLKLLYNIFERRKQKITIYVAYNKIINQNLPINELEFYKKLINVKEEEKLNIIENNDYVLILQDIPKIILPSGKEIGPLIKDQQLYVTDRIDKIFLIDNNICKKL